MFNITSKDATCPGCGEPCQEVTFGKKVFYECTWCAEKEDRKRIFRERTDRTLGQWRETVPPDMQRPLDRSLLHPAIAAALDTDGMSGCAFIGPSDSGKTRVAYALLKRAAMAGMTVFSATHPELRKAASRQNDRDGKESDASREFLKACRNAQALLIDDLGKGSRTEGADEALFDILNHRRDHRLLTHWTANAGSEWLRARFDADRGPAIVLRLARLTQGNVFNVMKSPVTPEPETNL